MRFRPGARLDAGQVQDQRGSRGRGIAVGGGAGGILIVVVLALLGVNVTGGDGSDPGRAGLRPLLRASCRPRVGPAAMPTSGRTAASSAS
jgi:hypothetical protein